MMNNTTHLSLLFAMMIAAAGCGPVGGESTCSGDCESTYTACMSCCAGRAPADQQNCQTTCACTRVCCLEACGGSTVGQCSICRGTDPGVDCQPSMTTDNDGDGYTGYQGDCNDNNPQQNPGLSELPGDGVDNNCDGIVDGDYDGDGYATPEDCNDDNPNVYPGAPEVCEDGLDNDCDSVIDDGCSPCEIAAERRSSVGCVFYAIDTNPLRALVAGGVADYAVVVSNVDDTDTANVVIEVKQGGTWSQVSGGSFTVPPLDLHTVVLPLNAQDGSLIMTNGAYRVTSDLPVIAYQFNPLDGAQSYLSDASLLLPQAALDTHYIVPAWPYGPADNGGDYWPAHIQIVASAATQVRVRSPVAIAPGSVTLVPNQLTPFDLQEGDVLQITVANQDQSFAGAYVEADAPVAVFSSNDCANVPASHSACCCEHLEEQVFGLQTWGMTYVGSRVPVRNAEPALWHVMAQHDQTTVLFDFNGEVTGLPASTVLAGGEWVEFEVGGSAANPGDFLIDADKPVLVTQFMVAADLAGSTDGDPSMVQAVSVEQFLDQYVVLVPTTWVNDFLVLTRPVGESVEVDGTPVNTGWVQVGAGVDGFRYEVTRFSVQDGVHVLTGSAPFGVIVVGYDMHDSYAYPGGLDQQVINPVL